MPSTPRASLVVLLALGAPACARLDELWQAHASRPAPLEDAAAEAAAVVVDLGDDAATPPSATPAPAVEPQPDTDASAATSADVVSASDDASDVVLAGDAATDALGDVPDASDDAGDAGAVAAAEDTRPTITALALRTGIVESPSAGARWIGYVRAGGRVVTLRGPVGHDGCPARRDVPGAGWHEVEGGGYVCVGYLASLTRAVGNRRTPAQPDLDASMPFLYGITHRPAAMYRWAPTEADERAVEPERFVQRVANAAPSAGADAGTTDAEATAAPSQDAALAQGGDGGAAADGAVRIEDLEGTPGSPLLRRMLARMYVSLDRELRAPSGTSYWHTQSGGYVRAGSVGTLRSGGTFQGVALTGGAHLPVAFAISAVTPTYTQVGTAMRAGTRAPRLTFFQLTGDPPVRVGQEDYYRVADGTFVRSRNVRVVTAHEPPADLAPGEKWIDVNLDHQSLVAYEGTTPVYVTVGSTGLRRRSLTENYETIQGGFRIQSKHVATTMDGNSNDGPYSIEDVPWVMYFEQSFALHGAFWHNGFGMVHSHGCVNLSPPDARWVFNWTEPRLPAGWHASYATPQRPGTRVYVHYDNQTLGERGGPAHVPTH